MDTRAITTCPKCKKQPTTKYVGYCNVCRAAYHRKWRKKQKKRLTELLKLERDVKAELRKGKQFDA
jgi:hypothetical protein